MGRNAAIGCLGALVLVLAALVLGGYFLVVRPVQNFLQGFQTPFTQQNGARETPPPAPRADVRLTRAQVQDFVRVRRSVREAVGQDFGRYENLYRDFAAGQTPSALELVGALRESSGVVTRAREAQRAALAREKMTEGEYANVRREVNRTLGVPEIDLQSAARALQNFQLPDFSQVVPPPSPQNRALIEPFLNELRPTAALGVLGL
ncbi:hypothetical protein [Deinococcus pimensis]|uniref:hypothetical protein n=1 Tax=Deinococcus pimensis TaxID=309888 RepID=UPI0004BAB39E|nr:hypothetical protein [Deinococcus pimensis]